MREDSLHWPGCQALPQHNVFWGQVSGNHVEVESLFPISFSIVKKAQSMIWVCHIGCNSYNLLKDVNCLWTAAKHKFHMWQKANRSKIHGATIIQVTREKKCTYPYLIKVTSGIKKIGFSKFLCNLRCQSRCSWWKFLSSSFLGLPPPNTVTSSELNNSSTNATLNN